MFKPSLGPGTCTTLPVLTLLRRRPPRIQYDPPLTRLAAVPPGRGVAAGDPQSPGPVALAPPSRRRYLARGRGSRESRLVGATRPHCLVLARRGGCDDRSRRKCCHSSPRPWPFPPAASWMITVCPAAMQPMCPERGHLGGQFTTRPIPCSADQSAGTVDPRRRRASTMLARRRPHLPTPIDACILC